MQECGWDKAVLPCCNFDSKASCPRPVAVTLENFPLLCIPTGELGRKWHCCYLGPATTSRADARPYTMCKLEEFGFVVLRYILRKINALFSLGSGAVLGLRAVEPSVLGHLREAMGTDPAPSAALASVVGYRVGSFEAMDWRARPFARLP